MLERLAAKTQYEPYGDGLTLSPSQEELIGMAWALHHQAHLAQYLGGAARAVALFVESFALLQKFGAPLGIASGLAGFAALAQGKGQLVRAARLFGAAEALRACAGEGLAPVAQAEFDRNTTAVQAQLDEATFAAAWEEGRTMTREAAVAYALEAPSSPPDTRFAPVAVTGRPERLTPREAEILRLVARGLSNQEIAQRLTMSVGTIKWYTGQIYSKLGVRGRTRALARAHVLGLLP